MYAQRYRSILLTKTSSCTINELREQGTRPFYLKVVYSTYNHIKGHITQLQRRMKTIYISATITRVTNTTLTHTVTIPLHSNLGLPNASANTGEECNLWHRLKTPSKRQIKRHKRLEQFYAAETGNSVET